MWTNSFRDFYLFLPEIFAHAIFGAMISCDFYQIYQLFGDYFSQIKPIIYINKRVSTVENIAHSFVMLLQISLSAHWILSVSFEIAQ